MQNSYEETKIHDINAIVMGENPRLPSNLDIPTLVESIGAIGLQDPIHVWTPNGEDIYEVIRGHRRTMALAVLAESDPKRFDELFGEDGIPAIRWNISDPKEALRLKLDHGGQQPLSNPHELQMSASMMFDKGFTEAQVANQLKPLITRLAPMSAKAREEIGKLEKAVELAEASGELEAMETAQRDLEKRIADMYRGRVQHLHNVARCPNIVNAALFFKADGSKPKGYEGEDLPSKITTSQVKALWTAHQEDLKELNEKGVPKYNRKVVGPKFVTKWKAILTKEAEDDSGNKTRDKAMSAKDMKSEVSKWNSEGFYKLTKRHSGDKSVEGLAQLDTEYRALDLVKEFDQDVFDMVIESGKAIEDRLAKEAMEASEAEAEATSEVAESNDD